MFSDIQLNELPRQPYYQDPIKQLGTGKTTPCNFAAEPSSYSALCSPAAEREDLAA